MRTAVINSHQLLATNSANQLARRPLAPPMTSSRSACERACTQAGTHVNRVNVVILDLECRHCATPLPFPPACVHYYGAQRELIMRRKHGFLVIQLEKFP